MKAIVTTCYGSFEKLKLSEIQKPIPKNDEVLIKVFASSVNYNNLIRINGELKLARFMGAGLFKPKYKIPGNDVAGRVEAIGNDIKQFKVGDEVFGDLCICNHGAFAQYVCVPEKALVLKPTNASYSEAAAAAQSALVALQGLRDNGKIKAGQNVLIYGASGGIGTFAVQIAKSFGANVTAVCSTKNLEMVKSLGADNVIDYTKEDFTKSEKQYDLILATTGYRSIFDYKKALTSNGIYVVTGGTMKGNNAMSQIYQVMFLGPWLSMFGKKKMNMLTLQINQKDLNFIKDLIEKGKMKAVIDRSYTLSNIVDALKYYELGHARGKVVITVDHNEKK